MSKFSLFTVFLAGVMLIVVAELLVNSYLKDPYSTKNLRASVLPVASGQNVGMTQVGDISQQVDNTMQKEAVSEDISKLTFEMVQNASFNDVILKQLPFAGIMFEKLDLRDFKSSTVNEFSFLKDNSKEIVRAYEFLANNEQLSKEIFEMIKSKAAFILDTTINQTNEYGKGSYYFNFSGQKDYAFLVVKTQKQVYAFAYLREYHQQIKKLINLISNN